MDQQLLPGFLRKMFQVTKSGIILLRIVTYKIGMPGGDHKEKTCSRDKYYISTRIQPVQTYLLHRNNCPVMLGRGNFMFIGKFDTVNTAKDTLKHLHLKVDPCRFCCHKESAVDYPPGFRMATFEKMMKRKPSIPDADFKLFQSGIN